MSTEPGAASVTMSWQSRCARLGLGGGQPEAGELRVPN